MKDTSSCKPFDGAPPTKTELAGARVRDSVCRKEERVFGVTEAGDLRLIEGDGGRVGKNGGEDGVPFRWGALEVWDVTVFFLALNGLKNDHSDSNWTLSSPAERGAFSNSAASSNWSILRSAKRMIKTSWVH